MGEADADYVCSLSNRSLEKAISELNEDPKQRLGAVQALRTWIHEQPHITCSTDTLVLLRFLRAAKYSQLRARDTIERMLTAMTENPHWFKDIDITDHRIQTFFDCGYIVPLPGHDKEGRRVILIRASLFNPRSTVYDCHVLFRAIMAPTFFEWFTDEEDQVNGLVYMFDMGGLTIAHQTFWGLDNITKGTKIWQKALPARFKGLHYYKVGSIFEVVFEAMKPVLSKKIKERVHMHGSNLEGLYKYIPMNMLPEEYLPDDYTGPNAGGVDDLKDKFMREMNEKKTRDYVQWVTGSEFKIDHSKKPHDTQQASFRKLNLD